MPDPDAPLPPIDDTPPDDEHPEGPKPTIAEMAVTILQDQGYDVTVARGHG